MKSVEDRGSSQRSTTSLEQLAGALQRFLQIVLWVVAVAVFAGSLLIMLNMDAASRSQGGRLYVAAGAIVVLGAVDTQYTRLARGRLALSDTGAYRRYQHRSLLLLLLSAVALVAAALLLP
jgi:hypothetical protein